MSSGIDDWSDIATQVGVFLNAFSPWIIFCAGFALMGMVGFFLKLFRGRHDEDGDVVSGHGGAVLSGSPKSAKKGKRVRASAANGGRARSRAAAVAQAEKVSGMDNDAAWRAWHNDPYMTDPALRARRDALVGKRTSVSE